MKKVESRQEIIDRIEAKYSSCSKCGKKGISKKDLRCFYCGSKK